jgi:plastocyanin
MRPNRLLLVPVTILIALAAASPAMAADWTVDVVDFEFSPREREIQVGDKVVWTFTAGGHTSTSNKGQPDSWDSSTKAAGSSFEHVFTKPGRYQYVCTPHKSFMKGTITVGQDEVSDTVDAFKAKRSGTGVTVSFRLKEPAVATYTLKGPSRKTVRKGRLRAGKQSFKVKGLKTGTYSGVLTLSDDFDNTVKPRSSFKVR